jgi:hypothetical protein
VRQFPHKGHLAWLGLHQVRIIICDPECIEDQP